ncbi:unknown similar to AMEV062 [Adoxophyes honmai entomopoxvirus 'L']|uniref:Uncharacterized protein n=1 Tax=Adoxophyes honmai entomopoxvirus 'L' TaxID=1293540 RepID=A0A916KNW8_9POXV|nr:unknown similar to AMEV062 [Adoxophyes honmai entomopoxvirus 'L']CCU55383.1 unknown similar to AMEV062 [Adoxophyes honmai entomopoxvirus 'L']
MDEIIVNELKKIYNFIDTKKFINLKVEDINLFKDVNIDNTDSDEIGLAILSVNDKKKLQVERISIPDKYNDYKRLDNLFNNQKLSGDIKLKDNILIELEKQKNNFIYEADKYKGPDLVIECFPEYCKICNNKINIYNDINNENINMIIVCKKYPEHVFKYEDYCDKN